MFINTHCRRPGRRFGDLGGQPGNEGSNNTTIAQTLAITERSVSKHIGNVFLKLGLPPADSGHRRVLAVLAFLNSAQP